MPVGVPKVPFLLNEQKGSDWVDLYNYMYHQGILFLCHELDDELTNQLNPLVVVGRETENFEVNLCLAYVAR